MNSRFSFFIAAFLVLIAFLNCSPPEDNVYSIGDTGPSGVGIVFYITDGGLHGLEAAPSDQGTAQVWNTITDAYANGVSPLPSEIGTGSENTDFIKAQNSWASSAESVCRNYNGGGLNDWFLPSSDELDELYAQRDYFSAFPDGQTYWSSSEFNTDIALWIRFSPYEGDGALKGDSMHVRAIRAF